jgi:hypothetical protein
VPPAVTPAEATALLEDLVGATGEADVSAIAEVLTPEVAAVLTTEQVGELIAVIDASTDDLTQDELIVLAAALTTAPANVKHAFEAEINVFSGKFDTYVPTGSNISVGQRRAVNAVVATVMAAPAAAATSRRK